MKKLHVYFLLVLLAPCCSFSQRIYERTREYIERDELSRGLELLDSCFKNSYHPDSALFYKGLLLVKDQKTKKALRCRNRLIAEYPRFGSTQYLSGLIYFAGKNYGKSIEQFNGMLALDPEHIKSLTNRALAAGLLEDYDAAISDLTKAITLSPGNSDLYYSRAYWLNINGKPSEAISDFNRAVQLDPKNYDAYLGIAQIYHNQKDPAKACETIQRAIEAGSQIADEVKNLMCR